ncbi:MAG: cation diffusion facilitator family transporter [Clostridia bacterium]
MANFLVKGCIKNYEDVKNPLVRASYGMLAGTVGIVCNAFLALSKIVIGVLTASVAIMADGINNFSDTGSSLVSVISFKMSKAPADKKHPFGHARFEYVASLIIACLILFLSFQLITSSVEKIISKSPTTTTVLSIAILCVSIVIKVFLAFFYRSLGKSIDSSVLKASMQDSLNDCLTTGAVLIGAIINMTTGVCVDGYFGVVVSIIILIAGIGLIKETLSPLLGESASGELINKLRAKICAYDGVLGVHDIIAHNYGPNKYFVSAHVEVDSRDDFVACHDLIDNIERHIKEDEHIEIVIHMDPIVTDDPTTNALREEVQKIIDELNYGVTMHDFRAVIGQTHTNLIFDIVIPFGTKEKTTIITSDIENEIKLLNPTYYAVISVDRG